MLGEVVGGEDSCVVIGELGWFVGMGSGTTFRGGVGNTKISGLEEKVGSYGEGQ